MSTVTITKGKGKVHGKLGEVSRSRKYIVRLQNVWKGVVGEKDKWSKYKGKGNKNRE